MRPRAGKVSNNSSTMMEVETSAGGEEGSVETALASQFEGFVASGSYVVLHVAQVPLQVSNGKTHKDGA